MNEQGNYAFKEIGDVNQKQGYENDAHDEPRRHRKLRENDGHFAFFRFDDGFGFDDFLSRKQLS